MARRFRGNFRMARAGGQPGVSGPDAVLFAVLFCFHAGQTHILQAHGVNLSCHESRPVTEELMENATDVYAMTESHLAALLANFPEHADKIRLVTCYTDNRSIADPIGCGQAAYNSVARQLTAAIQAIIARMEQQA